MWDEGIDHPVEARGEQDRGGRGFDLQVFSDPRQVLSDADAESREALGLADARPLEDLDAAHAARAQHHLPRRPRDHGPPGGVAVHDPRAPRRAPAAAVDAAAAAVDAAAVDAAAVDAAAVDAAAVDAAAAAVGRSIQIVVESQAQDLARGDLKMATERRDIKPVMGATCLGGQSIKPHDVSAKCS
jgi:hypothetical protein